MDDTNLKSLINLLSYLKKHDDVESELDKDKDPASGHAAGRTTVASRTDPRQKRLHAGLGIPNREFSPEAVQAAREKLSSQGSGTPGSTGTTSGNIPDVSDGTPSSEREYDPEGFHTGERKGTYFKPGEHEAGGPEVTVVSPSDATPSDDVSDISDFPSKEEREVIQWFRDEGWTLADLKQALEEFTAPPKEAKTPLHHVIRSDSNERITKSNESIILNIFKRLGI